MSEKLKILVTRTDNLGDLILSLPAIKLVKSQMQNAEVSLLAKRPFLKLFHSYLRENEINSCEVESSDWRNQNWDAVLCLYLKPQEAFYFLKNKVPKRFGNYTHLWSPFVFNKGLRQRRSLGEKNEADYSLELARLLLTDFGKSEESSSESLYLPVDKKEEEQAVQKLQELGLKTSAPFFIVHPGMAGSALNLTAEQYREIIEKISQMGLVLVSVGPNPRDQEIWKKLSASIPTLKKVDGLSLEVLKEVFRKSRAVIAPSTGPLHLAHAVGVPTIGIYSPIRSHHPKRWAPKGGRIAPIILVPPVKCPAKKDCLGSKCSEFDCFQKLDWASLILNALNGLT